MLLPSVFIFHFFGLWSLRSAQLIDIQFVPADILELGRFDSEAWVRDNNMLWYIAQYSFRPFLCENHTS